MKHVPCHLHDGTFRTLRHSSLLRRIRYRHLLHNTMILQEMEKYFGSELPAIVQLKRFDFLLQLRFYKCFELLELLKATPFEFQHIQPHILSKIVNESYKIPCTANGFSPHRAIHANMHDFQRLGHSFSPLVRKRSHILFAFNAHFTKQ